MVVTTPDQSDHSTDEQDYDHPNLHEMNMAGCDGDQTKKKQENKTKIMLNIIHHKDNDL
ncbi:hypothetical protein ZOSMA_3G00310 [Zostera marina]|uniref:Uncharacterized protein n=1 Tax=Zostera marina TaxID=29655 RepID=A0A0K9P3K4_ZOSMR|nr:hypothetical protein ZOSMA_3G00310 [Zostera marina]